MKKTYGNKEIQDLTGLSKIQVIHLTQTYVVKPFRDAKGRGAQRLYDQKNLIEFSICKQMGRLGLPVETMRAGIRYLEEKNVSLFSPSTNKIKPASFWQLIEDDPQMSKPNGKYFLVFIYKPNKPEVTIGLMEASGAQTMVLLFGCVAVINLKYIIENLVV